MIPNKPDSYLLEALRKWGFTHLEGWLFQPDQKESGDLYAGWWTCYGKMGGVSSRLITAYRLKDQWVVEYYKREGTFTVINP